MNKFYLVIIISFVLFQSFVQAQNSFPKYEDKPVWCVWEHILAMPERTYSTELRADTIICGQRYNSVWANEAPLFGGGTLTGIIGYLRTEGEKVLFRNSNHCNNPERLLYDFSLEEGDTIKHSVSAFEFGIISKIDTITYNGVDRKVWIVNYPQFIPEPPLPLQKIWVEGIGDLFHPFRSSYCNASNCEFIARVICFSTNTGVLYGQCTEPCNIENNTTDTDDIFQEQSQLYISPNPLRSQEALQINYHFPKATEGQFFVVNTLGKVLYQQAFQAGSAEGSTSLSWSPSVAGVYWLVWQDHNGGRQALKFISQ
ncbi:MAG: T9SS type A sorting domain-containing protein [Saprospiraceae bacterium]|nr:T9SS type A sorting domain-containing protein [Saprospiraceae bacterium]